METIKIKGEAVSFPWRRSMEVPNHVMAPGEAIQGLDSDGEVIGEGYGRGVCLIFDPIFSPLILAAPQLFIALKTLAEDYSRGYLDADSFYDAMDLIEELEANP